MPSQIANKRLANKVISGLEDINALCQYAEQECIALQEIAREAQNVRLMAHASNLRSTIGVIWRKAVDARHGKYQD